ncbi:unnamed protein product [Protopolystoma xenopodis]|uniref:DNA polymerase eta n=1 Tax=Protopolystoma xenopodis TaxID=117903 RepID=A0A448WY31_9PLAT|nr:unnamed protein product [Protopolystoma xenopodis]
MFKCYNPRNQKQKGSHVLLYNIMIGKVAGTYCFFAQLFGYRIIAVSYEARSLGVTRIMRGDDAKEKCPDIILFKVPSRRGKADLRKFRKASTKVMDCISRFVNDIERASIDEAYLDITNAVNKRLADRSISMETLNFYPGNHVVLPPEKAAPFLSSTNSTSLSLELNHKNWRELLVSTLESGSQLIVASELSWEIRKAILNETGFSCSVGIAQNKTIAKLACSLNKPNRQTMVPPESVDFLLSNTPVKKIRNLGGKLGLSVAEQFKIENLGELSKIPLSHLTAAFGEKTATWLYALCRGTDTEPVTPRSLPKSIGCSKNFLGQNALTSQTLILHWLRTLSDELVERLREDMYMNNREATCVVLYARIHSPVGPSTFSRTLSGASTYLAMLSTRSDTSTSHQFSSGEELHISADEEKETEIIISKLSYLGLNALREALSIKNSELDTW